MGILSLPSLPGIHHQPHYSSTIIMAPGASSTALLASNLFSVAGRTAVVTGGGTGIGLMITQALAANGAKVYITGRRQEELEKVSKMYGSDGNIIPVPGDVSNKAGALKLASDIASKESCIHLLVNNAGVAREEQVKFSNNPNLDKSDPKSLSEHLLRGEDENWADTFKTNSAAVYMVSAAFLPPLAKGNESIKGYSSSIVNITSISGIMKTPSSGQFAYAASKASALQTTRNLANTFVDTGVRVNSIAPGIFPSEMTAGESDENNKSELPDAGKGLPADRPGKDEDMAASILFLAGRGGVFYNGQIIHPDGGALVINPSSMWSVVVIN